MSLSSKTSTLTLAYINTTNNISQLDMNIRDLSNNVEKINETAVDLLIALSVSLNDISGYTSQLLDISNNI